MSKFEVMVPHFQDLRVAGRCKLDTGNDNYYCQFSVSVFFAHCVLQYHTAEYYKQFV